jgi:serine/threonine-protein kinase
MIGRVLSERYRIEAEIANGGMAEVYRAFDEAEQREVAIKLIKKEFCEDREYIRRFEREVNAVLSLEHPNIVRAYDFGVCDGRHYLVMELVEGHTLKDLLETKGRLSQRRACYIACKVLDALSCAHENGYVHRDVKPQNVLISNNNEDIKLTDFGIAKSRQRVTNTFDSTKVIGSVEYMSPEQVNGEAVTEKSDLYSVGIMLYEMLTGKPPFDGDLAVNIAMQHIKQSIKPPREIDPRISRALSDVVLKATAKDRSARYDSAKEMKRDILRAIKQPKGRFARIKKSERNCYDGVEDDDGNRSSKLKTGLILGAAGLVLVLIAVMFISWIKLWSGDSDKKLSKVPDLLGRSAQSAKRLLHNREFEIKLAGTMTDSEYDAGTVCKQIPAAGTAFEIGSEVEVWISSGTETVSMPNLVGKSFEDAALLLDAYGIAVESISFDASESSDGKVLWQSIPEGTELVKGDESISIEISGSKETTLVPMPDLSKYKTTKSIADVLRIYGLEDFVFSFGENKGGSSSEPMVMAQLPSAGRMVLPGNIRVVVTLSSECIKAFSNVEFSIPASQTGGEVRVTLLSENGEFLLCEAQIEKSSEAATIAFSAGYLNEGKHTLVVYANDAELMRLSAEFKLSE